MEAVKTINLTKKFGETIALNEVCLNINEGEIFGLLGVNGAGKTTLIRILSGLSSPTSGNALVYGKSVLSDMPEIKELIGISPQETSVAPNLTVKENLVFFASVYAADKAETEARVKEIIASFHLEEVENKKAKLLSGGWQRRLSVAASLISRPRLLFLDEPTLGLDVLARRELWKIIGGLKGKMTVVLTSHYLEEIEALCDRVALMSHGRTIACGTTEELKRMSGENNFEDAFVKIVETAEGKV